MSRLRGDEVDPHVCSFLIFDFPFWCWPLFTYLLELVYALLVVAIRQGCSDELCSQISQLALEMLPSGPGPVIQSLTVKLARAAHGIFRTSVIV